MNQSLETGHVVRKAARRGRARANEQRLHLGALKELPRQLAERHELMYRLQVGTRNTDKLLERIGRSPWRRRREPVASERRLPVALVSLQQRQVHLGVPLRDAGDLLPRRLNIRVRPLRATVLEVDDAVRRMADERGT